MAKAITRLFDNHEDAVAAVRSLEQAGIPHHDISLIANNSDGRHGDHNKGDETADGAGKGATSGGMIGGGAGLLAGLGMLAIPGLGPVVAAGWLASTAVGAVVGAVAGGAAGGLLGALKDSGHSDEEANVYAEGVRRGGTLVSVKTDDPDKIASAEQILASNRGVEANERGAAYRQSGWERFDASATPYSADQMTTERGLRGEGRSFQGSDEGLRTGSDLEGGVDPLSRPIDPTIGGRV